MFQTLLLALLHAVHLAGPIACELRTQAGGGQMEKGRGPTCEHAEDSGLV